MHPRTANLHAGSASYVGREVVRDIFHSRVVPTLLNKHINACSVNFGTLSRFLSHFGLTLINVDRDLRGTLSVSHAPSTPVKSIHLFPTPSNRFIYFFGSNWFIYSFIVQDEWLGVYSTFGGFLWGLQPCYRRLRNALLSQSCIRKRGRIFGLPYLCPLLASVMERPFRMCFLVLFYFIMLI